MSGEKKKLSKADCVLCHREVKGNVNPEMIITCGHCVQILLTATRENKIAFRDRLLAQGKGEEARSVEAFIVPEANGEIATFKRTLRYGHFRGFYTRCKAVSVGFHSQSGGKDGNRGKE